MREANPRKPTPSSLPPNQPEEVERLAEEARLKAKGNVPEPEAARELEDAAEE